MTSQTAVITGGNTGLGYASASALLASKENPPWHVVLASRNEQRARDAVTRLTEIAGTSGRVEAMALDLASLESIRAFAGELTDRRQNRRAAAPARTGGQRWRAAGDLALCHR